MKCYGGNESPSKFVPNPYGSIEITRQLGEGERAMGVNEVAHIISGSHIGLKKKKKGGGGGYRISSIRRHGYY